jgi:ABC-type Mn2+/Zn2+ transport system permease subunit
LTYETGYVGLLFIGALLMKPAVIALRAYRTLPKPERYFCINCVSCLVSFFVVMISVAAYGWGQNGQMLWVVIAMTVSYVALSKRGRERQVPVALPAMEEMAAF